MSEVKRAVVGERNLDSMAAKEFCRVIHEVCAPDQVVKIWNKYLKREAVKLRAEAKNSPAAQQLAANNFARWRRTFMKVNGKAISEYAEELDNGTLRLKKAVQDSLPFKTPEVEQPIEDVEQPIEDVKVAPPVEMPRFAADIEKAAPPPDVKPKRTLEGRSETEKAILMGVPVTTVAKMAESNPTWTDDELKAELLRGHEESEAAAKKQREFVEWACRHADSEADALQTRAGETLWKDAVSVEAYPEDPTMKVVLVRSSTAPLFFGGTSGPTVKHDFKANDKPVTFKHERMFRQLDNQKLIRSRVMQAKKHEYYVKGLQYQEGMYFKGYFEVDGVERYDLARFYTIRDGKVMQVTESEYRDIANKAAATPSVAL